MAQKVFITIAFISSSLLSVSQINDAGLWVYFGLEKDLPDKFTTGIEVETRFNENISELGTTFAQPYISKEWSKALSTTLAYRAIARRQADNTYQDRDRFNLDFKYKKKVKEVGVQYRLRVQRALGILDSERAVDADFGFRHRLKFDYGLSKKWKLGLAGESFYALQREEEFLHTDIRIKLSARYRVKKRQYLGLGYIVQQEYNRTNPRREFIITVGYTLMIK
ncbi:MAG: DUF2490 domain-containing protein [Flavobacteriales bacterium]